MAAVLASLALVLALAGAVLHGVADEGDGPWVGVAMVLAAAAPAILGALVARRVPRNPIGWLLLAHAMLLALSVFASGYAAEAVSRDGGLPLWRLAVVWYESSWVTIFAALAAIALLFPDGRLPSPRWKPVAWGGILAFGLAVLYALFEHEPYEPPFEDVENPLPAPPDWIELVAVLALAGMLATLCAAGWAVRTRLRRAEGIERQQLRWLAWAGALIPTALGLCLADAVVPGDGDVVIGIAFVLVSVGIPAAVAVAVLRYRLYDLDRIVNRTLVYAVLTALLAAGYVVVTLLVGLAVGGDDRVATAAATLAVAVAFRPLRRHVQNGIDRRFNRARYEALRRVEAYVAEVRDGRAAAEEVGRVLAEALRDPSLELLFWLPESRVHVDAAGRPREPSGAQLTPVRRGALPLGTVAHAGALAERPDTLDRVLAAAGLAIEIARLRAEVRRQLAEVADSRARLVAAADDERRRLERDLHDGAQQRLVSIGLALRHTQRGLPPDARARVELDGAVDQLGAAIGELRQIAHGLRPARLDDGLAAALQELARESALPVDVDVVAEALPPGIEDAAYFVACEALTNAAKHAQARSVSISAVRDNGLLRLRVSDDGVGGASLSGGSGLVGLADRVGAHGGRLEVVSPAGAGPIVVAELPVRDGASRAST